MYRTTVLPFVLYACETWSRMKGGTQAECVWTYGGRSNRKLHNEEPNDYMLLGKGLWLLWGDEKCLQVFDGGKLKTRGLWKTWA